MAIAAEIESVYGLMAAAAEMAISHPLQPSPASFVLKRENFRAMECFMEMKTGKTQRAAKKRPPQTEDEKLDEALDESFPASDPPAQTQPIKIGSKQKPRPQ